MPKPLEALLPGEGTQREESPEECPLTACRLAGYTGTSIYSVVPTALPVLPCDFPGEELTMTFLVWNLPGYSP